MDYLPLRRGPRIPFERRARKYARPSSSNTKTVRPWTRGLFSATGAKATFKGPVMSALTTGGAAVLVGVGVGVGVASAVAVVVSAGTSGSTTKFSIATSVGTAGTGDVAGGGTAGTSAGGATGSTTGGTTGAGAGSSEGWAGAGGTGSSVAGGEVG